MTGALIVAPLRPATTTWPKELEKWADFEGLDLVVLHGKNFAELCREQHDFYVVNYEGLAKLFTRVRVGKAWSYRMTDDGKELMKHVNALVWDELSKMKNSNSMRFALVKPWLKKFLIKWGLTGSPAANGLLDLFGQCFVLDEGRTLGPFVTHYRHQYFLPTDQTGYNWRLKHGADEDIYTRLRPLALRMEAEDYLKLPAQLDHVLKYDLPASARGQYEEMEEHLLTLIGGDLVSAANQASASSKCRQMASGAIYLHDLDPLTGIKKSKAEREWVNVHDVKLDMLADLIEELQGQQLLVAYDFHHDLEKLLAKFPGTPYIGGGVSTKRGLEIEAAWNAGEIPLLFGHPASISLGLNLQESHACHVCWFTLTWNYEDYDQLNRRLRRQGNDAQHIHVYHMIARDTVDESVYYALRRKYKTQKQLLDALKTRKRVED